jgi:hypothetical protein
VVAFQKIGSTEIKIHQQQIPPADKQVLMAQWLALVHGIPEFWSK